MRSFFKYGVLVYLMVASPAFALAGPSLCEDAPNYVISNDTKQAYMLVGESSYCKMNSNALPVGGSTDVCCRPPGRNATATLRVDTLRRVNHCNFVFASDASGNVSVQPSINKKCRFVPGSKHLSINS